MPRIIRNAFCSLLGGAVVAGLIFGLVSCSPQGPVKKAVQNPPKKATPNSIIDQPKTEEPIKDPTTPNPTPVSTPAKTPDPATAAIPVEKPNRESGRTPSDPISDRKATTNVKRYAGYPTEIAYVKGSSRIALTFDAGASAAPTPAILAALKDADLQATFFLTGKWCEKNPELTKQIINDGHEIGNHSYSHPDFRKISDSAIAEQLKKTENIVVNLTGQSTKPLFRPPYGGRNKHVLSVVGGQGYTSIYWSLDSWDAFKKRITSTEIRDRILKRVQGGDIVLLHCGSEPTAKQLPELIEKLKDRGFTMVKVSELIAENAE